MARPDYIICLECEGEVEDFTWREGAIQRALIIDLDVHPDNDVLGLQPPDGGGGVAKRLDLLLLLLDGLCEYRRHPAVVHGVEPVAALMDDLRQETQKIREQTGIVHGSASKLSAALEKIMEKSKAPKE